MTVFFVFDLHCCHRWTIRYRNRSVWKFMKILFCRLFNRIQLYRNRRAVLNTAWDSLREVRLIRVPMTEEIVSWILACAQRCKKLAIYYSNYGQENRQ